MTSLKNRQSGFTIVELLIVIVIIGILAGLVVVTFTGVQQRARNSERQTDINAVASQLEAYHAKYSGYPSLADLNQTATGSSTFRAGNDIKLGDSDKAMVDPSSSATTFRDAAPTALSQGYSYEPKGANPANVCNSPTSVSGVINTGVVNPCISFTLTAFMEAGVTPYVKKSGN